MATVSVTIPDQHVARVRAALRALRPDLAQLSDAQLTRRVLADELRRLVAWHETEQARAAAADTANADLTGIA